jgi:MarR family transcriptional regulator, organic hydroperoxide resistance regulator
VAQDREKAAQQSLTDDEVTREIVTLANELVGRIWVQTQTRMAEFNLSVPEAKALQSLEPGRPLSMRELAARLHANPSNVTVSVGRLEARGLVARQGTGDRRVKNVLLTASGLAVRQRLEARLMEGHPAVSGLSEGRRETLRRILHQLSQHASEAAL